jgi:hypothetical protein
VVDGRKNVEPMRAACSASFRLSPIWSGCHPALGDQHPLLGGQREALAGSTADEGAPHAVVGEHLSLLFD